ncbi:MAG TPA: DUF2934 domain-containing protein [Phycisphaerales bacterium]|nr:DUF2934 domain-containing protein [Phycisphaerales bacterium]
MSTHVAEFRMDPKKTPPVSQERAAPPKPVTPEPATAERIRTRAYEIYQHRNGKGDPGDETSDWLQAEQELNGAMPKPSSTIEARSPARGDVLLASRE